MEPKQAWGAFSALVIAGVAIAAAVLYDLGAGIVPVLLFAVIVPLVYSYVLYKRYNVEVITENDVMLFDDPDDLRIICLIYGLDAAGEPGALRLRLLSFVRTNKDRAFVWVAPKAVLSVGSVLRLPGSRNREAAGQFANAKPLIGGKSRTDSRLSVIDKCPVCEAQVPKQTRICRECGADLEFYEVLKESRLGRLMLSEKSGRVRRKLRYDVPSLREDR